MSNLVNLKELQLWENNIKQIDVSNNQKLEKLGLSQNKTASLDIRMLTQLKYLNVEGNCFESINYTNNLELEELKISNN